MAATPSSKLYSAIWTLLETSEAFKELVKPKNRVKFDSETNRGPLKDNVQSADLPEVILVSEGFTELNIHNTSSSTKVVETFSLIANTGDFRLSLIQQALNWYVLCSIRQWQSSLSALTWKGVTYVKRVDVVSATTGQSNSERNRQIQGWVTVWRVQVEMHFATANLVDTEEEESP